MPPLHLDSVRAALAHHRPERLPWVQGSHRAAVSLVLAGEDDALSLCFIRRAERAGDPWSGHMAFPGGRVAPEDASIRAAAERETREEIGLDLGSELAIGVLSDLPVKIAGVVLDLTLSSFVYHLGPEPLPLDPDPREVAEAHWIPLEHLWSAEHATRLELERLGRRQVYPAIRFQETAIWGLTHRLLGQFSDVLGHPLPDEGREVGARSLL